MTHLDRHAYADLPDSALIKAIAKGEAAALDSFYARYGPAVLNFLFARLGNRQQAEEVLQDVMLAVWRGASAFRGDSRVLTWILTIARNRAINAYRKYSPNVIAFEDELDMQGDDTGPLERVERLNLQSSVREAIELLPAHHREVLTLIFFNQLSGEEAASVLGVSVGTVKSRLFRAKENLRRLLQSEELS
ncbi:MAG: RNA polymerase sigma factor [Chloroflexota bacterium]